MIHREDEKPSHALQTEQNYLHFERMNNLDLADSVNTSYSLLQLCWIHKLDKCLKLILNFPKI